MSSAVFRNIAQIKLKLKIEYILNSSFEHKIKANSELKDTLERISLYA